MALPLNRLIECNLTELLEAERKTSAESPERFYLEVLIAYLKGDLENLARLAASRAGTLEPDSAAAKLRWQVRSRAVDPDFLSEVICATERTESLVWKGELNFVIAFAFEVSNNEHQAQNYYKSASEILELAGCPRKSIKAFSNYIAAETRIHPEKKLIVEYDYVYRKAKGLKEFGTAGMALNNISREYQRAGAFNMALKYVNRALAHLRHDFGSLHYYLAVVHRAHLLFDLKREREAALDLEQARSSPFPEIQEAVKALHKTYSDSQQDPVSPEKMTFTWKERLQEGPTHAFAVQLGGMEEKLVRFLATGSFDKFEIIEHLYGKDGNFEAAENRFKNLIGRIRKKHPGLIAFSNGKYKVADLSFLPAEYLKAG